MADSRTTKQNYQDIADAIRSVNGESIQYTPVEMAPKIQALQKKNGDQIIDHYDLTLLHKEDNLNADMPTDSWDEKITEFNFDISDKKIPNIYQKFIIYFDFVLNSQYTPEEYNFFIRTYDISQNIISFPLMYGGININKYMKTDGYIDFDNNTSPYYGSCDFDRPNVTNTGFSFSLDINYITFDDCLLNINFLCHIASTNDFESLEYPFDSSRLAIYGATPVYK